MCEGAPHMPAIAPARRCAGASPREQDLISFAALLLGAMAARRDPPDAAKLPANVAERWLLALRSLYLAWPADEQAEVLASLRAYRDAATDPAGREDADATLRFLQPLRSVAKRSAPKRSAAKRREDEPPDRKSQRDSG
jgi:hypothetical protein